MAHSASLQFLIGFFTAAILAWPATVIAARRGWVSVTRADRSGEGRVPVSGGAPLIIALALPVLLFPSHSPWRLPLLLLSAAAFGIGAWDDLREMKPLTKGLLTALLAVLSPILLATGSLAPFPVLALSCWVFLHAFNIIDNMDGLALGTALPAFAGLALISGNPLAWAAAGATAGAFLWNLPPARLYLGDGGSLLLGMWSWGWGVGVGRGLTETGTGPGPLLLLWALPLLDFAFVTVTRTLSGRPPWIGGRDHLSHKLAGALESRLGTLLVWIFLQLHLVMLSIILLRRGS